MPNKKPLSKYLLIVVILVAIIGYVTFDPFLKIAIFSLFSGSSETASLSTTQKSSSGTDQNLVGNWDTGCLIPDKHSNWAERHTFEFSSNGAANHKRYSGSSCGNLSVDHDDKMTWEIVGSGKINLYYETGGKIYDIYEISGTTLKFGHGFCNCVSSGGTFGSSIGDRFVKLNDFLSYKKQ